VDAEARSGAGARAAGQSGVAKTAGGHDGG
jgi:hypothetical protein